MKEKKLIEQREQSLITICQSKYLLIPSPWLKQLEIKNKDKLKIRLMQGKHGKFIDGFKI